MDLLPEQYHGLNLDNMISQYRENSKIKLWRKRNGLDQASETLYFDEYGDEEMPFQMTDTFNNSKKPKIQLNDDQLNSFQENQLVQVYDLIGDQNLELQLELFNHNE